MKHVFLGNGWSQQPEIRSPAPCTSDCPQWPRVPLILQSRRLQVCCTLYQYTIVSTKDVGVPQIEIVMQSFPHLCFSLEERVWPKLGHCYHFLKLSSHQLGFNLGTKEVLWTPIDPDNSRFGFLETRALVSCEAGDDGCSCSVKCAEGAGRIWNSDLKSSQTWDIAPNIGIFGNGISWIFWCSHKDNGMLIGTIW